MDTDSIFDRPIRDDYVANNSNRINTNQNNPQNFVDNNSSGDVV
jgi:hypothetical protein